MINYILFVVIFHELVCTKIMPGEDTFFRPKIPPERREEIERIIAKNPWLAKTASEYINDLVKKSIEEQKKLELKENASEHLEEMLDDAYQQGFEDGFSEDISWVIFTLNKLIEDGKIPENSVDLLRKKFTEVTYEEKEEWWEHKDKKEIDKLFTEEEWNERLKKKKKS